MKKGIIQSIFAAVIIVVLTYGISISDTVVVGGGGGDSGFTHTTGQIKQTTQTDKVTFGNYTSGLDITGNTLSSRNEITLDIKGAAADYQTTILATSGLVSYWKMDESSWAGAANEVVDSKGTNHGRAINGATTTTSSKYGTHAGTFSGSHQYVTIANNANLNFGAGNFTIEAWFNIPDTSTNKAIYASASDTTLGLVVNNSRMGYFASSNGTFWDLLSGDSGSFNGHGTINISPNIWHHVAFVRSGNSWYGYIDGVQDIGVTVVGTLVTKNEAKNIGYWGFAENHYPMHGSIDEFAIYNVALSAETIDNHAHMSGHSHLHVQNSTTTAVDVHLAGDVYFGIADTTKFTPSVVNEATAIAHTFSTDNTLSTAGAKIISFQNAGTEKAYIDKDGKFLSPEIIGSTTSTGGLTLTSTSHATKGTINLNAAGTSGYDQFLDLFKLTNLTASRAVVSDASNNLISSSVTSTELGYVSGVTSAVQTQIDGKVSSGGPYKGGFKTISSAYTVGTLDYAIVCHTRTNLTVKLPAASASNVGRILKFKKRTNNTNKVYMNATTGQLIDYTFAVHSGIDTYREANEYISNGTGWDLWSFF